VFISVSFLAVHSFLPKILCRVTKKMAAMLRFLTTDCPDFTDQGSTEGNEANRLVASGHEFHEFTPIG